MSALRNTRQTIEGTYANYTVTESVDDEGFVTITFAMDPPPVGYAHRIWSWLGRLKPKADA